MVGAAEGSTDSSDKSGAAGGRTGGAPIGGESKDIPSDDGRRTGELGAHGPDNPTVSANKG
jgi:hypothetical protein